MLHSEGKGSNMRIISGIPTSLADLGAMTAKALNSLQIAGTYYRSDTGS